MRALRLFTSSKATTSNNNQGHNLRRYRPQHSDSTDLESDDKSHRRPKKKRKIDSEKCKKSTENEKKSTIAEYTPEEEQKIIDYLINKDLIPQALTSSPWKRMVTDQVLPCHYTSSSLFAHFVGSLLTRYKNYTKTKSSRQQFKELLKELEENRDSSSEEYSDHIPTDPSTSSSPSPPTSPKKYLRIKKNSKVNNIAKIQRSKEGAFVKQEHPKKVKSPVECPRYLTVQLERLTLPATVDKKTPEAGEENSEFKGSISSPKRVKNCRNKYKMFSSSSASSSSHEESLEAPVTPPTLRRKKSKKHSKTLKKPFENTGESSRSNTPESSSSSVMPPVSPDCVKQEPLSRENSLTPPTASRRQYSEDEVVPETPPKSRRMMRAVLRSPLFVGVEIKREIKRESSSDEEKQESRVSSLESRRFQETHEENENYENNPPEDGNNDNNVLEDPGENRNLLRSDKKIITRARPGGRFLDIGSSSSSSEETPVPSGRVSRVRSVSTQFSAVSEKLRETLEKSPDLFENAGETLEFPGERLESSTKPSQYLGEPMDISQTPHEDCMVIDSSDNEESSNVEKKSPEGNKKSPEKCKDAAKSPIPIDDSSGSNSDDSLIFTTQPRKTGKSLKNHNSPVETSPAKQTPEKLKTPEKKFTAMNDSSDDDSNNSDIPVQLKRNGRTRRISDSPEDSLPEVSKTHRIPPGKKRKLITLDAITSSPGDSPDFQSKKKSAPSPAKSLDKITAPTVNKNNGRHPVNVSGRAQYDPPDGSSPEGITSPKIFGQPRKVPVNVNSLVKNPFKRTGAPGKAPVRSKVSPAVREIREESPIVINSSPEVSNSSRKNPVSVQSPKKKSPKKTGHSGKVPVTKPAEKRLKFMDLSDSEDSDFDKHAGSQNRRRVEQGRNFPDAGASTSTGIRGHEFERGNRGHLDHNDDDDDDDNDSEAEKQPRKSKDVRMQAPKMVLVPAGIEEEDENEDEESKAERRGGERGKIQTRPIKKLLAGPKVKLPPRRFSRKENIIMVQALSNWDCLDGASTRATWRFLKEKYPEFDSRDAKTLANHFDYDVRWNYKLYTDDPLIHEKFRIAEENRQSKKEMREKDDNEDEEIEGERRGGERGKFRARPMKEAPLRRFSQQENITMVQALNDWDLIDEATTRATWKFLKEKCKEFDSRSVMSLVNHFDRDVRWNYQLYTDDPLIHEKFRIAEENRQSKKEMREKRKKMTA